MKRALAFTALLLGVWAHACSGQSSPLTVNPVMSRGPATAPVTIYEFSDYQ